MSKPNEEIAAEILIAAIGAKVIAPGDALVDARAETLMRAYGVILGGLQNPPESRLPKSK